ncbi:MAG: amidohydrolase [Eubacteriales bacterium]
MDILISNATVVTMDNSMHLYLDGHVGITDGKITYISPNPPADCQPKQIIDGTGMVLMPGLINCHTHLPMTILRGFADDMDLQTWLFDHIFPKEEKLDDRAVKAATLLGIAECLQFGVTSVSEMYDHIDAIAQAVAESGIKANISRGTTMFLGEDFDFETFPACQELVSATKKWHNHDNGRIKIEAGVHAEYTSSHHFWDKIAEFAISEGLSMQVHLSETKSEHQSCEEKYGLTPAEILDCHHVFAVPTQAAHCVWLTEDDRALLAKRNVTAVHCPTSNLKLASGVADVMSMVKAGMNVAIGTDSACSNNNLDLFKEIRAAALLAKEKSGDPAAVSAAAALLMGTVCGARAQGRQAECGIIAEDMDADLILVDFTRPHLMPCHNVVSNLVYAANGSDVVMTMVRGNILYSAGKFHTIDMNAVVKELAEHAMPLLFAEAPKEESHG